MNQKLKTKHRKAILLLLAGLLFSNSFLWTHSMGAGSLPHFLRGFAIGLGVVLMIGAVFRMARNKREFVSKG